jgi:probable HAF family extracellular repeat protein
MKICSVSTLLGLAISFALPAFAKQMAADTAQAQPTPINAPSSYTITDLGTLGGFNSFASAINDLDQVTGYADLAGFGTHAFLYEKGRMKDLGTLGGPTNTINSFAFAINIISNVVGNSPIAAFPFPVPNHAFLYSHNFMMDLGTLGGNQSTAYGVNDLNQVVGQSETATGAFHAFLYSKGKMYDLGTLGGSESLAFDINDSGVVVGDSRPKGDDGFNAFILEKGHMRDLGSGQANAINELGQVVGVSFATGHGFFYSNGKLKDLNQFVPLAINNLGQMVGSAATSNAALFSGGQLYDLNNLIPANSGWRLLFQATGINDSGKIVGIGFLSSGPEHAFLLTPSLSH